MFRVLVIGATIGKGISTKSGRPVPYEFGTLTYLAQNKDESRPNDDSVINSCGFGTRELSMEYSQGKLAKVRELLGGQPRMMELTLSPNPDNPTKNMVVDFKLVENDK